MTSIVLQRETYLAGIIYGLIKQCYIYTKYIKNSSFLIMIKVLNIKMNEYETNWKLNKNNIGNAMTLYKIT